MASTSRDNSNIHFILLLSLYVGINSGFLFEAGAYHNCFAHQNQTKCWGLNLNGQLGYGSLIASMNSNNLEPIDLGSNFIPAQIALGGQQTYVSSISPTTVNMRKRNESDTVFIVVLIVVLSATVGLVIWFSRRFCLKRKQRMMEKEIKAMHIPYKETVADDNRPKVNAIASIPISAFVTNQGTEHTTKGNDDALDEIEGEQKGAMNNRIDNQ
eukprot:917324_1